MVNLGNIAVMACIMKITAVQMATAIWEYDPSLPQNHMLGGSLDVIAAVQTLAIKVHCLTIPVIRMLNLHILRFNLQANTLNTSKSFKSNVASKLPSSSGSTVTSDEEVHMICLNVCFSYARYAS